MIPQTLVGGYDRYALGCGNTRDRGWSRSAARAASSWGAATGRRRGRAGPATSGQQAGHGRHARQAPNGHSTFAQSHIGPLDLSMELPFEPSANRTAGRQGSSKGLGESQPVRIRELSVRSPSHGDKNQPVQNSTMRRPALDLHDTLRGDLPLKTG